MQSVVDYIANNVDVQVEALNNTDRDVEHYVQIALRITNTGPVHVNTSDWQIYFNVMYGAKAETLKCGLHLGHVNGLLYYLRPSGQTFRLPASQELNCVFKMLFHASSRFDFMPNWYVHVDGALPKVLQSTAGEDMAFVGKFNTPEKWKTSMLDTYHPFTAADRYNYYQLEAGHQKVAAIIPTPKITIERSKNKLKFTDEWKIQGSLEFENEAQYLSDKLKMDIASPGNRFKRKYIYFENKTIQELDSHLEAYRLDINTTGEFISITATHNAGAFYGVQTLLSIRDFISNKLPDVVIKDVPRFQHRGLSVDVARNFRPVQDIKKLIELLATYKMNRLHLHLTDDEGWRLQIPSIPELTEVGSNRCHIDSRFTKCLIPSLGSGPYAESLNSSLGFYSISEYKDLLKFANERHVKIIPEIDMPGHSRAAVASMQYRSLVANGTTGSDSGTDLLLDDIELLKESQQRWRGNAMNPCLNSTYTFIELVITDMIALHAGLQDLNVLHIGGDEVVFAEWEKSPSCMARYSNMTSKQLQRMFMQKVTHMLAKAGLKTTMWEEGLYENGVLLPPKTYSGEVFAQPWYNTWENGNGFRAVHLANAGYKVILSLATHLYLGHSQEPDPEERGTYWGSRYIDTYKVFGFIPSDIQKDIETTSSGKPLDDFTVCSGTCPELERSQNFIGLEACLWAEEIRTTEQFYEALFPRLLAVAERAWHKASWEDFEDRSFRHRALQEDWALFVSRLGRVELPRLEQQGAMYKVPPPGAFIQDGRLICNTLYPNHTVEAKFHNETLWREINGDVLIPRGTKMIDLRSRTLVQSRRSRVTTVDVKRFSDLSSDTNSMSVHVTMSTAMMICCILLMFSCM